MADYVNTRSVMGDDEAFDALIAGDLETLVEDGVTTITPYAVSNNTKIKTIDLPNTSIINAHAFENSTNLKDLILRKTNKCTVAGTNSLGGTAIANKNGAVFVPSNLVSLYKADSTWKNYNIIPLDEYPTDDYSTIRDTWTQIDGAVADGSYKTKYAIGDTKLVNLGSYGKLYMQIVAFDSDELTEGGAAAITWIVEKLPVNSHGMNSQDTNVNGYPGSEFRTWLNETMLPLFPSDARAVMKEVKKTSYDYTTQGDLTSNEKLWIPSKREVFGGTDYESSGPIYDSVFKDSNTRIKLKVNTTSGSFWWLRSTWADDSIRFRSVDPNGLLSGGNAHYGSGVCLGFCT